MEQKKVFLTGNEAIAEAAKAIDFHFMGYYPITPSTEIAEKLDEARSKGEIRTVLLPADGEHGAAGACFGASTAGARVLNATSANGLLYSLEQLPVQSGLRQPMVLNLVTRSVSGPLDIRCDHSDLAYALQTGWIVLAASTAQGAYDLNIIATKLTEHPQVRLPVMVVTDGFFTSHERQSLEVFSSATTVKNFLGPLPEFPSTLDPRKPITVGPYMNDPDLVNNKVQLHQAHQRTAEVFDQLAKEYQNLTGRLLSPIESYQMDDAQEALFILNSAAEVSKDAIDQLRAEGKKVGILRPTLLRPFPYTALKNSVSKLKKLILAERADTPGVDGGIISNEVRAFLHQERLHEIQTKNWIFGIGGQHFTPEDAKEILNDTENSSFQFHGALEGQSSEKLPKILPALSKKEMTTGLIQIKEIARGGEIFPEVQVAHPSEFSQKPKRIAPGHGACPGCGIFSGLDQFFKGIEGDVVVLYHTGCAMVVTTAYPFSSHRVTYLHNLFQNGAPTLSGLVETFYEKKRRGEIHASEEITFVMVTGDGGMDIGMGPTIGTAIRNHPMIVVEYDNQGYMNTGGQLSYSTPKGHATSTSHVGSKQLGKLFRHKDTVQILAATGIPYCFSAIEGYGTDLIEKAAKAQWYANREGLCFGRLLVSCPLNWKSEEQMGQVVLQKAADSCFFPVYEIERGNTFISYNPEDHQKKIPIRDWFEMMGKTRHLLEPKNQETLNALQTAVDLRWERLKAKHAHPLL